MPDYGIQVFNSNGNVQIDNTYASFGIAVQADQQRAIFDVDW